MGLIKLIRYIKLNKKSIMVEIGSYAGESTEFFSDYGKCEMIYAVDPWSEDYEESKKKRSMADVEDMFDERLEDKSNILKFKMTSEEAVSTFEDGFLDFVYIDGSHIHEMVKQDIKMWTPKVKVGGYVGGHDYQMTGVSSAVHELLGKPTKEFRDDSWVFKISGDNG